MSSAETATLSRKQQERRMRVTAAGNTEVPAFLVLIAKGYEIVHHDPYDGWVAQKGEDAFENWCATDEEIAALLAKYPGT